MSRALLVLVTGAPCTGKTSLARRIAAELRLPFISKDGIKVSLFESLGWKDREWSRRLDTATYEILFYAVEAQLLAGRSLVVESNLKPALHTARFKSLQDAYGCAALQILCETEGDTLIARFDARAASGKRHPGHCDDVLRRELREMLEDGRYGLLGIDGESAIIDTTDFGAVDLSEVIEEARRLASQE